MRKARQGRHTLAHGARSCEKIDYDERHPWARFFSQLPSRGKGSIAFSRFESWATDGVIYRPSQEQVLRKEESAFPALSRWAIAITPLTGLSLAMSSERKIRHGNYEKPY